MKIKWSCTKSTRIAIYSLSSLNNWTFILRFEHSLGLQYLSHKPKNSWPIINTHAKLVFNVFYWSTSLQNCSFNRLTHDITRLNDSITVWSLPHDHNHMIITTWSLPHDHYHMIITTWPLPHDHYHMTITTWPLPYDHYHMTITIWPLP